MAKERPPIRSLTAVALAALCAAAACSPGDSEPVLEAEPRRGGTLVVGLRTQPDAFNPYVARTQAALELANRILPRLWREVLPRDGEPGGLEPEMVRAWSFDEAGTELTLELREGAVWTDGTPFGCEDLVFTLEAQTDPALGWPGAGYKRDIERIRCPGPHRAVVEYAKRSPTQLMDLNDLHVLPRSIADIPRETWRSVDWAQRLPTLGPFRVAEDQPAQGIVLERYEDYWGGPELPRLDRIVYRDVAETVSAVTQLKAGDVHLVRGLGPEAAVSLAGAPEVEVVRRPGWRYVYIGWNTLDPEAYARYRREREASCERQGLESCPDEPEVLAELTRRAPHPLFGDARVRRAMTLAIDRQLVIDTLLLGEASVPSSPILAPLPEHDPALVPWPHDPERALELLREAGFEDADGDGLLERDGQPLAFEVLVSAGKKLRNDAAVMIKSELAAIGVSMDVRPIESSAFYPTLFRRRMDAWIGRWHVPARVDMTEILHASSCATGGGNFGCWWDADADALAMDARDALDRGERASLWHQWEYVFHDEQPYTMLFRSRQLTAVRDTLRGVETIRANDELNGVETWWIAEGSRGR
jgi:peptide/nickel transport system substrate-binding protein